jgi:hypothetical protein
MTPLTMFRRRRFRLMLAAIFAIISSLIRRQFLSRRFLLRAIAAFDTFAYISPHFRRQPFRLTLRRCFRARRCRRPLIDVFIHRRWLFFFAAAVFFALLPGFR